MKLLTLRVDGGFHPGVMIGDAVLDLVAACATLPDAARLPATLRGIFADGHDAMRLIADLIVSADTPAMRIRLQDNGALRPFDQVVLGPVVPDPDLLLSGSMNSHGHLAEMGDGPPEHPCAFVKVRSAISASGADIVPPPGHGDMIDWEGEFCVVIGRRCHQVTVDEALDYAVGYTLLNDVSAREYVAPFVQATGPSPTAQAWERNLLGKNYPGFAPIGPVVLTRDAFPEPLAYHMETLVNGVVMQSSTQDDLVFRPAEMIAYYAQFYVLEPGDIISMGSPKGVGMARRPPVFLKPGDVVEVRVAEIGTLRNRIAAAAL